MGYTTDFYGQFDLDKPLTPAHYNYLTFFAETRRMKRNTHIAETFPDVVRKAADLPIGVDGGYYVGSTKDYGQERDASIVDFNSPPDGQPGRWCQWVPNYNGTAIVWDGGEKFYEYTSWLEYIIEHFLKPWGYTLNGEVKWEGEDSGDMGIITVKDNVVTTKTAVISYV